MDIPRARLAVRPFVFCGGIIEKKGKILLVKVKKRIRTGWDLPGGKLLLNEHVVECTKREILEESGYTVKLEKFLGVYQRDIDTSNEPDYFRFVFTCSLKSNYQRKIVDPFISKVMWFKIDDILKNKVKVRSKQVVREVSDYMDGKSYPLDVLELYVW